MKKRRRSSRRRQKPTKFSTMSRRRAVYDQYGQPGIERGGGGAGFSDVEDIFDAFGDMFGGAFGDMFGGGRRRRGPRKGARIETEVVLDLEEAARGVTRPIEFDRAEKCGSCDGKGSAPGAQTQTCQRCGGRGQVVQSAGILRVQTTCQSCGGAGQVITDPCKTCPRTRLRRQQGKAGRHDSGRCR